jgi:hypothetical protein
MESYAFLAAQFECTRQIEILRVSENLSFIACLVKVGDSTVAIEIEIDLLPPYFLHATPIYTAMKWIREKEYAPVSAPPPLAESIARLHIEMQTKRLVKSANLKNGVIEYVTPLPGTVQIKKQSLPAARDREQHYSDLVAARALLEGYTIREVKGSHFNIRSDNGKQHTTNLNVCTCVEFEKHRDCTHLRLAQVVHRERHRIGYLLET